MKQLIVLCVAAMLLATAPAMAQVMTGDELKKGADQGVRYPTGPEEAFFTGFVIGVSESSARSDYCVPNGVTKGQICEVVRKYLKDHPEELHEPASVLVHKAIRAAWPCKKQ